MMKVKKIYICTTYYHVLITLAKSLLDKEETDIVLCDDIIGAENLCDKLNEYNIFKKVYFVRQSIIPELVSKNFLKNLFCLHKFNCTMAKKYINIDFNKYSDIYIFHDDTKIGHYLNDAGHYYHLIEDSLNFYQKILRTPFSYAVISDWKYYLKRILNYKYLPLGNSKYVIDVEVNENKNLKIKRKKIVEVNRNDLLNKVFLEYKNIIFDIFLKIDVNNLLHIKNKALILTEPLYEDNILQSEQEQIDFYKVIAEDLKKKFNVYIKPHPRDCIDYSLCISDINIIKKEFPIEVFNYIEDLSFSIIVSKSSSCMDALNFAEVKISYTERSFLWVM